MICENCNSNLIRFEKESVQGWECPICGWNILTTDVGEIYTDTTEYSIFIIETKLINKEKIKVISEICNVNFIRAKQILNEKEICLVKEKAPKIKNIIQLLQNVEIKYIIYPYFKYLD